MMSLIPSLIVIGLFLLLTPLLPRNKHWARTIVVSILAIASLRYMWWRTANTLPSDLGSLENLWMAAVFATECVGYTSLGVMLLVMTKRADRTPEADRHEERLRAQPPETLPHVDILIPTYNEELEVLRRTILGAADIDYPNFTVYVLDDSRRDWLRDFCRQKGVEYVRRDNNEHAKAGNLNNGLTHAKGEFFAVLDADFVPLRNFLYRTIGFFEDPKIGMVQTPQYFFNPDPIQHNLKLTDAWIDEQRLTFEDLQPSRDAWDCAYCCGSCSVMRREAVDEAGGIPTESVTEDVLTTLVLLRKGYITRYLNEKLTHGLAPESLEAFFVQRQRWCRGGVQIMFSQNGPFGPGLTWKQRLFFSTIGIDWIVQCLIRLIVILIPLSVLLLGMQPYQNVSTSTFLFYLLPVWLSLKCVLWWLAPRRHLPLITTATWLLICFRIWPTVISTLIRPFGAPFRVTPKGNAVNHRQDWYVIGTASFLIAVNLFALTVNRIPALRIVESDLLGVAGFFCFYNMVLLALAALMAHELPRPTGEPAFPVDLDCTLNTTSGPSKARIEQLSVAGADLRINGVGDLGKSTMVELPGVGPVNALVDRRHRDRLRVRFDVAHTPQEDRLISWVYGGGLDNSIRKGKPTRIARRLLRRVFTWS